MIVDLLEPGIPEMRTSVRFDGGLILQGFHVICARFLTLLAAVDVFFNSMITRSS